MKRSVLRWRDVVLIGLLALGIAGCSPTSVQGESLAESSPTSSSTVAFTAAAPIPSATTSIASVVALEAATTPAPTEIAAAETVEFTLKTAVTKGKMVYIGVGGAIDGLVNPDLEVKAGASVQVTLVNGDGMAHDITFPDFGARSSPVRGRGDSTVISFEITGYQAGVFVYYCTFPGHRKSGQEGRLIVSEG